VPGSNVIRGFLNTVSTGAGLVVACLLMMFVATAQASGVPSLSLTSLTDEIPLARYAVQVRPDEGEDNLSDVMTIADDRWSELPESSRSLGRDYGTTWFRLDLQDTGNLRADSAYLLLDYPHYDFVDVFLVSGETVVQSFYTGDQRGFDSRPIDQRTYLFPLEKLNAADSAQIFFRISTPGPLLIPFSLITGSENKIQDRNSSMALGIYFGILLIMFAYNAFISGSLRDTAYIYYLVYMASVGLHQLTLQGLGYQYFWPESTLFDNNFAVALSSALMQGTAVAFVIRFIRLYENFGRFDRIAGTVLLIYSWLLVTGAPFMEYASFLTVVNITGAVSVSCGLYIGIVGWRKKVPYARLFAMAWFIYLIFIAWYLLELASILPTSPFGEHILAFGSVIELALLSIAFADRINHERELRLRSQSKLMDVQVAMNAELEEKVRLRTSELEEANRRLEILSTTDGLTGLFNRRHFDELYEKAYLQACRDGKPLAVLMIDIDHFKQLNDNFGHRFGDLCLIDAGRLIRNVVAGQEAICARYGGEEFVVILPDASPEEAQNKAEALRLAFARHVVTDGANEKIMTISVGLTVEQPVDRSAWEKLLQAADSLLYTAKRNGRNQVAFLRNTGS